MYAWAITLEQLRISRMISKVSLEKKGIMPRSQYNSLLKAKKSPRFDVLERLIYGMGYSWKDWTEAYEQNLAQVKDTTNLQHTSSIAEHLAQSLTDQTSEEFSDLDSEFSYQLSEFVNLILPHIKDDKTLALVRETLKERENQVSEEQNKQPQKTEQNLRPKKQKLVI